MYICIYTYAYEIYVCMQLPLQHKYTHTHMYRYTANPTWGDIFECSFKAQSSKLERLFCHVSVKRDVRALSFEL